MSDLNYNVKISSAVEIRALRELEASLQKQIVQAKLLGKSIEEIGKLQGQLAATRSSLKDFSFGEKAGAEILGFAEKVPVLGETISALNGTLGAASAGLGVFALTMAGAKKAVEEFAQAEKEVAKLDAALAQTGQLTEEYRARLQNLAQELQDTTGDAGEEWLNVLKRLTQFGSTPESIGMDVEAVKNLAGVVGDVTTAANLYSRALVGNFEVFGRYGFKVTEGATNLQKLAEIQEQAKRGAGQLEAQANSLSGGWDKLKNSTADVWKELGRMIAGTGVLQKTLGGLGYAAKYWGEVLGGTIPQVAGLQNRLGDLGQTMAEAQISSGNLAKSLGEIKTASDQNKQAFKEQMEALDALYRRMDRAADADMAKELAQLDFKKEQTGMSEVQYVSQEAAIRKKYADKKFQRDQEKMDIAIAANKTVESQDAANISAMDEAIVRQTRKVEAAKAAQAHRDAQARAKDAAKKTQGLQNQQTDMERLWQIKDGNTEGLPENVTTKYAAIKFDLERARRAENAAVAGVRDTSSTARNWQTLVGPVGKASAEQATLENLQKTREKMAQLAAENKKELDKEISKLQVEKDANAKIHQTETSTAEIKKDTAVIKADETDKEREEKAAKKSLQDIQRRTKSGDSASVNPEAAPDAPTGEIAATLGGMDAYHEAVKAGFGNLADAFQKKTDDLYAYVDQRVADVANT